MNVAPVLLTVPLGPVSITVSGGVVSIVTLKATEAVLVLPAASVAFAVIDRVRDEMLNRVGFSDLLKPRVVAGSRRC